MTLTDLNNSLQQLASKQNRESILDFAFALMNWMGIEPNSGNTPQLLAPKTQKLKEYLENAPKSVQSQLYRISADSQPIRIRFAVLKKLKKDYISQLVDNDPGAESYQNTPAPLRSITKAPYFIHFVATPAYDKLVLIFNQGDQKRVVSFRSRLTNTQYNKIIQQWQNIARRNKTEIADLFWKSLDIKEVNKEFYKQIKERFDALIGIVKTQSAKATEGQVKQFTVRMIGRYIFCWFLREKGIIAHELIGRKSIIETKDFYQNVLLKLFFETLNTKVQDRNPLTHEKHFEKIPYLNGGLFDESDEDRLFRNLKLDDWLKPFVEILESYDFTVDESSSQYQQVAVDPEMLGRIFENLLASQNEDTEKLANQRRAFGAFYTPREIVEYMVNESIKAYLASELNIKDEDLIPVFAANSFWPEKLKSKKIDALNALERIKILDPACGSGAFPMGILHKLVELHELLGTVKSSYELKKDILSRNIYGVDIMPMAIEIARLRAWLSLVLEEEYKPNDFKHNFGLKPLPNLDFKFICANSLIDSGFDRLYSKYIADEKIARAESMINLAKEIPELIKIKNQYFDAALLNKDKEDIVKEYEVKKEQIKKDFISLRRNFKEVGDFIDNIDKWNPFDESQISPFFSPNWMFGIADGFDLIISNPPYVRIQNLSHELIDTYKKKFKTAWKRLDISTLFFELSYLLLKDGGHICFISSNQFLKAEYGRRIRGFLSGHVKLNIDYSKVSVFEGQATYVSIFLISNKGSDKINYKLIEDIDAPIDGFSSFESVKFAEEPWDFNLNEGIKAKIFDGKKPLGKVADLTYGVITGLDKAFLIENEKANELDLEQPITRKFVRPQNYKKYHLTNLSYTLIYPYNKDNTIIPESILKKKYPNCFAYLKLFKEQLENRQDSRTTIKEKGVEWYSLMRKVDLNEIDVEKIVFYDVGMHPNFFLDNSNLIFGGGTSHSLKVSDSSFQIKYLLGILNSKLMEWIIYDLCPVKMGNARKYGLDYIKKLPIASADLKTQTRLIKLVDKITLEKQHGKDSSVDELHMDTLVYKLYNMTYSEVKTIDPNYSLSEEEYFSKN